MHVPKRCRLSNAALLQEPANTTMAAAPLSDHLSKYLEDAPVPVRAQRVSADPLRPRAHTGGGDDAAPCKAAVADAPVCFVVAVRCGGPVLPLLMVLWL